MVLARVVIHVLARVLPHVLARALLHVLACALLHVLARVIIHVHDYYSKTCPQEGFRGGGSSESVYSFVTFCSLMLSL